MWTVLLLKAAPAKGCQEQGRRQVQVAAWNSTDTQLAAVPTHPSTPSHYGAHSCAPSFQSPGQSVSHPPAWGPACTVETVTQAAPANSSTSTAGDARLSLTNCLCRCVLLGRSLKRWLSTQHREQEKTVRLLLQARYFFLYQ